MKNTEKLKEGDEYYYTSNTGMIYIILEITKKYVIYERKNTTIFYVKTIEEFNSQDISKKVDTVFGFEIRDYTEEEQLWIMNPDEFHCHLVKSIYKNSYSDGYIIQYWLDGSLDILKEKHKRVELKEINK